MKIKITEKIEHDWELAIPYPKACAENSNFEDAIHFEICNAVEEYLEEDHFWISRIAGVPHIIVGDEYQRGLKVALQKVVIQWETSEEDRAGYSDEELEYWLKDFEKYKSDLLDNIVRWDIDTQVDHNYDECDAEVQY